MLQAGRCRWMAVIALALLAACAPSTPRSRAAGGPEQNDLTPRERRDFLQLRGELQAPCTDRQASVEQCMQDPRGCAACSGASEFLLKAIRDGRSHYQIDEAYQLRFSPDRVKPIDLSDVPVVGPSGAPVTIVEFADFQCPACARMVEVLDAMAQGLKPYVRVAFKHFPLPVHEQAEPASRAAVAAQRQGKFWEMHHRLFESQRSLGMDDLDRIARELGLDFARFRADLGAPETAARVRKDHSEGSKLAISVTPTLFINGRKFDPRYFETGADLIDWVLLDIEIATGKKLDRRVVLPAAPKPASSARGE